MKTRSKRLWSALMALVMILSLLPLSALAEEISTETTLPVNNTEDGGGGTAHAHGSAHV